MNIAFTNIKQLATMTEQGMINDATLIFNKDNIIYAGPTRNAPITQAEKIIDLFGALVTPGLIDAHTHTVFAGNRINDFERRAKGHTYEEIANNGGGIMQTVQATREASQMQLAHAAEKRMEWMMQNGTTTAEVKSGYALKKDDEIEMLSAADLAGTRCGMRVVKTLLAAHAIPTEYATNPDGYVNLICKEIIPEARKRDTYFVDVFVESIAFNKLQAEQIIKTASFYGMQARLHVDQLADNQGAAFAAQMNAKTADHLEYTSLEGIQCLAKAKVQPVLLPASVLMLGKSKYPNARAMIEAGLDVVLATDFNPGSSPVCSLPAVMSLAVTMMKMTPEEALKATTINAAKSLNLESKVGKLEPGMQADFVVWDAEDYREIPYWLGAPLVKQTWIAGVQRVPNPS